MQTIKSKKMMLLIIILAGIFALGVTTSLAQEKNRIKRKCFGTGVSEQIEVGDIDGHVILTGTTKGVEVNSGATIFGCSTSDLVNGNGTMLTYVTTIYKDGLTVVEGQGKISTTMSPEGKPLRAFEGSWSYVKGTGKWKNVQGNGTFKGKYIGPGIFAYDSEGEYFIKK